MVEASGRGQHRLGAADLVQKYFRQAGLPTIWCPGCGTGTVTQAMVRAIDQLGLNQDDVVIVTGIGCSGFIYNYLNFDGYHGTHGRALPAATGIKLANPQLKVIVPMGDGDCTAIGGNHFIHAARRNIDLTAIVVNNNIYGMTGGQYSPLTPRGRRASTAPTGHLERAFDIGELARAAGATYVARGTTYHVRQLIDLLAAGIKHEGFAVIEVISQCPVQYGRRNPPGTAADILLSFKERAVSLAAATKMSPEQLAGRIVIGELWHVDDEPEFTKQYDELIRQSQANVGSASAMVGPTDQPVECDGASPEPIGRREILLAGVGGQGLALAGVILAEAAGIYEGRYVMHSAVHGVNSRGGPSHSEVIISDEEIDHPFLTAADILVATTAADVQRYLPVLKPDGILLVDALVGEDVLPTTARVFRLPLTAVARSDLGSEVLVGIVALAAIAGLSQIVSLVALSQAVTNNVPAPSLDLNRRAIAAGLAVVQRGYLGQ